MENRLWVGLQNLILVAGHAVYIAPDFRRVEDDESWFLENYQKGEPHFYIEHIQDGVQLATNDSQSLLVFSGGQTRRQAGPRSEAQSYWILAGHFNWWSDTDVSLRATTEEFARDSFENLLFGICRFREAVGNYPRKITVVSWAFKEKRFELHREAIRFPSGNFFFKGVNNPVDLVKAEEEESKTLADFAQDPYGTQQNLRDKRDRRNPFNRQHPYTVSCKEVSDLLQYCGPNTYTGKVPW